MDELLKENEILLNILTTELKNVNDNYNKITEIVKVD